MKRIIIVGNGLFAAMVFRYFNLTDSADVIGFVVDEEYRTDMSLYDRPVYSIGEFCEKYKPDDVKLIMGVGYKKMNTIRMSLFERLKACGYSFDNYIHPTAIIAGNATIGEGNVIMENVVIQESVVLGNANLLWAGCVIGHQSIIGNYNTIGINSSVSGFVNIGDNCFFGTNATLRDKINVADYTLVGASAYLDHSSERCDVLVPGKSIKLIGRSSLDYTEL